MNIKKWFSLIELLLVIIIIIILFLTSKNLFQTPNKYLIDSEACINSINGHMTQFFYQGVTGKDKTISGSTYEPNTYNIQIQQFTWGTEIGLYISTGENSYLLDNKLFISNTWSNILWCNTTIYSVIISGQDIQNNSDNISIILNKNLSNSLWNAGMRICKNYNLLTPTVCDQTSIPFSSKIDFLVCKKNPSNNVVDMNTCKHTYSSRFDTATQSLKLNRCLNILYDQPCRKRSIDNF
jgi:hypothetical protein